MIEVGKKYKCVNGCVFHCIEDRIGMVNDGFRFYGHITNISGNFDRIAYYSIDGCYSYRISEYDLISLNSTKS